MTLRMPNLDLGGVSWPYSWATQGNLVVFGNSAAALQTLSARARAIRWGQGTRCRSKPKTARFFEDALSIEPTNVCGATTWLLVALTLRRLPTRIAP